MEYQLKDGDLDAKIFLPKFEIDLETMKQVRALVSHPTMDHVRLMPDCHKGNGCCVGLTSRLTDKIVPNYVGGDIGCGILCYPLGELSKKEKKLLQIEKKIRQAVPMGMGKENVHPEHVISRVEFDRICQLAQQEANEFAQAYQQKFQVDLTEKIPNYNMDWFDQYCVKIQCDRNYALRSLGTLGGGNHFIEVGQVDDDNSSYLTIHSGSRYFGLKVCRYHQDKINKNCKFDWDTYQAEMKKIRRKFKNSKLLKEAEDQLRSRLQDERHAKYLEEDEAYEYYFDMIFAQKFAKLNRELMLRLILTQLGLFRDDQELGFDPQLIIESIHNYIDFRDLILRKGSISAHQDQICLVALNMRDGVLICRGKGNQDWNYSSAHGSGRRINRQKASSSLKMKEFKAVMDGIVSTSIVPETLDESPMAYKDTELIKTALDPSVEILKHIRPVINLKGLS